MGSSLIRPGLTSKQSRRGSTYPTGWTWFGSEYTELVGAYLDPHKAESVEPGTFYAQTPEPADRDDIMKLLSGADPKPRPFRKFFSRGSKSLSLNTWLDPRFLAAVDRRDPRDAYPGVTDAEIRPESLR